MSIVAATYILWSSGLLYYSVISEYGCFRRRCLCFQNSSPLTLKMRSFLCNAEPTYKATHNPEDHTMWNLTATFRIQELLSCSTVLVKKVKVSQLVMKLPAIYIFITVHKNPQLHHVLGWVLPVHTYIQISFRSI